jgi:hypothetical protein
LRMSVLWTRSPGGWPSQYVRSTPTRSNVLASRRAINRPWPPAMPVMSTVSPGLAPPRGWSHVSVADTGGGDGSVTGARSPK